MVAALRNVFLSFYFFIFLVGGANAAYIVHEDGEPLTQEYIRKILPLLLSDGKLGEEEKSLSGSLNQPWYNDKFEKRVEENLSLLSVQFIKVPDTLYQILQVIAKQETDLGLDCVEDFATYPPDHSAKPAKYYKILQFQSFFNRLPYEKFVNIATANNTACLRMYKRFFPNYHQAPEPQELEKVTKIFISALLGSHCLYEQIPMLLEGKIRKAEENDQVGTKKGGCSKETYVSNAFTEEKGFISKLSLKLDFFNAKAQKPNEKISIKETLDFLGKASGAISLRGAVEEKLHSLLMSYISLERLASKEGLICLARFRNGEIEDANYKEDIKDRGLEEAFSTITRGCSFAMRLLDGYLHDFTACTFTLFFQESVLYPLLYESLHKIPYLKEEAFQLVPPTRGQLYNILLTEGDLRTLDNLGAFYYPHQNTQFLGIALEGEDFHPRLACGGIKEVPSKKTVLNVLKKNGRVVYYNAEQNKVSYESSSLNLSLKGPSIFESLKLIQ